MTNAEAHALVSGLVVLFPQLPRKTAAEMDGLLRGYAAALLDVQAEVLTRALLSLARTTKWFPAIAEIRAEAARLTGAMPPPAESALLEVHENRERRRLGQPERWSHALVRRTAERLHYAPNERSDNFDAGRFRSVYQHEADRLLAGQEKREALPAPVVQTGRFGEKVNPSCERCGGTGKQTSFEGRDFWCLECFPDRQPRWCDNWAALQRDPAAVAPPASDREAAGVAGQGSDGSQARAKPESPHAARERSRADIHGPEEKE